MRSCKLYIPTCVPYHITINYYSRYPDVHILNAYDKQEHNEANVFWAILPLSREYMFCSLSIHHLWSDTTSRDRARGAGLGPETSKATLPHLCLHMQAFLVQPKLIFNSQIADFALFIVDGSISSFIQTPAQVCLYFMCPSKD
jgi:hypothetical protein